MKTEEITFGDVQVGDKINNPFNPKISMDVRGLRVYGVGLIEVTVLDHEGDEFPIYKRTSTTCLRVL